MKFFLTKRTENFNRTFKKYVTHIYNQFIYTTFMEGGKVRNLTVSNYHRTLLVFRSKITLG